MKRDYEQYRWSITTLDRRLHFFDINYIHNDTSLETVQAAVQKELNGPGKLLGHIALNQELRMHHVQILSKRCYKTKTLKAQNFTAHLRKSRREKGFSLVIVRLMLYLLTVTRNCVGIKVGRSPLVCMDVLTLIPERSYFCTSATRI